MEMYFGGPNCIVGCEVAAGAAGRGTPLAAVNTGVSGRRRFTGGVIGVRHTQQLIGVEEQYGGVLVLV